MKTPISYYGGKQKMLPELLKLVPTHTHYVEPFFGGGCLFWAKKPASHEVINDINNNLITFYRVLKNNFEPLHKEIDCILHSEAIHKFTKEIYDNPEQYNDIQRAYALWVQTNMSFANKIKGGFAFEKEKTTRTIKTQNYKKALTQKYSTRLNKTYIFNRSALDIIERFDQDSAFMYFDPPYAESNCGHYEKEKDIYYKLLELLPKLKSNWLMSSYPSGELTGLREKYNWNKKDKKTPLAVSGKRAETKYKTECLTWNYNKGNEQLDFFKTQP